MFTHVLELKDRWLAEFLAPGMVVVDATLGNGHDALKIKECCPSVTLHGFDVQAAALEKTRERLEEAGLFSDCHLHLIGHEKMAERIKTPVDAVVFNLGYLPGNKDGLRTQLPTTLAAVEAALSLLLPGGLIFVIAYPGHPEGREEREGLLRAFSAFDQRTVEVSHHRFLNQRKHPPELFLLQKK